MKNLTERIEEVKEELAMYGSPLNDPLMQLILKLLDELVEKSNE